MRTPFYGWRKMVAYLRRLGYAVNGKRVRRLMRLMGIQAIYPRRSSSSPGKGHKRYPYLLRNLPITHVNQVWSADITYVPLLRGFMYLVAVIDWHSRYVLAWQFSNTLDGGFCLDALRQALVKGRPKIFNTDQGAQFTADAFTACLLAADIRVSMDGRGRALDNVFCERLWRSVKYENIYLNQHDTVRQLLTGLISAGTRSDVELAVSCRAARASSFLTMRRPAELAATCGALGSYLMVLRAGAGVSERGRIERCTTPKRAIAGLYGLPVRSGVPDRG